MKELFQDIADDPKKYAGLVLGLAVLLLFWCLLSVSAIVSLRGTLRRKASGKRKRLVFELLPFLVSIAAVFSRIPVSVESGDFETHADLGWFFVIPLLLSGTALICWWKESRRMQAAQILS